MFEFFQGALFAGVIAGVALLLASVLDRAISRLALRGRMPAVFERPLQAIVRWAILVVAILLILSSYNIGLSNLWTLVSTILALFAIAFIAVWSMLSHVSAMILIFVVRPFEIDDYVEFIGEKTRGRVRSVGLMFTTLEDDDGTFVQVPNNIFFQKVLRRQRPLSGAPPHGAAPERYGE